MKIIISPAKKMNVNTDASPCQELPVFIDRARVLMEYLKSLDFHRLREIWKCSHKLAEQNYQRLQEMDLERLLTPAILSYEGIQYQYLSPGIMEEAELAYLQKNLRILSGFYGILKPFDGVVPYRLEMQARLGGEELDSLYEYWGSLLAEHIFDEDRVILNLASREYSRCISQYRKEKKDIQFITCVFGERSGGRILEKGTPAKMARGEMVRYLAGRQAEDLDMVKEFQGLGYRFSEEDSHGEKLVFVKSCARTEGCDQGEPYDK